MKYPCIRTVEQVAATAKTDQTLYSKEDRWVPARPCGYPSIGRRFRAAWLVFTGQADAVTYPGQ